MSLVPAERRVRIAIVGLGRIYDLNVRGYLGSDDVEVVALVDPSHARLAERGSQFPLAHQCTSIDELASSGIELDAVEALVPIVDHAAVAEQLLRCGWHVNLQKPMCNDLVEAARMKAAVDASGRHLRIMENYLFYEPLCALKAVIDAGEIGEVVGYHMKMVASGRGGWEVPGSTYDVQFAQARRGRGVLVFDDGWHKLSTALWLFGPVREVRAWVGSTEVIEGIAVDAPTTMVWEHENGVRGVLDITLAVDMYLRSDYYTNDERWEVTGRSGFARVNRCTARGIQQPSFEVYRDGELRAHHALDDDWASSFEASTRHWIRFLRTGEGPLLWGPDDATQVLRHAIAAYESSAHGGVGVDPRELS